MRFNIVLKYVTRLGETGILVLSNRSQSEINAVIRDLKTNWGAQSVEVI